uniref:Pol protein n=1 Tax=Peronospora matthiolae TaxID=2874970 RepID=A0AAV1TGA9_9STRA
MKTHPVFYVGRLKRYVDPQEMTYPHLSNETDGDADCESSVVAEEATGKTDSFLASSDSHTAKVEDSVIEEDSALGARLSAPVALASSRKPSGGHTPDGPSSSHHEDPKSVARLDFRDQSPASSAQRFPPASELQQGRRPQIGGRNRHSYRAPPVSVDAAGNKRFLVGRLLSHRSVKQKL